MAQRITTTAARGLLYLAIGVAWSWCVLALLFYPVAPRWLGMVLAMSFGAGTTYMPRRIQGRGLALRYFWVAVLVVLFAWLVIPPTHGRAWSQLQAVMPRAEFQADRVTVRNIRRTVYAEGGDRQIEHYDGEFDLNGLRSVWFGVQHFASWRAVAHTFISFGFEDGRYLAISVESRRREGEAFSPLAGFFKQYGLIYIVGDEQDVIGQRALRAEQPIYLYPIKADRRRTRAMFVAMLRRANQLADRPEFYNTLTNNCTTNIVESFNQIAPIHINAHSLQIILPGYSGAMAYDQGLIAIDAPFEAIQKRAHINDLAQAAAEAQDFSERIRARLQHQ